MTISNLTKTAERSKRVENTVGKGEIARYEQFLLFPQCFQKAFFPGVSKVVIVWELFNYPERKGFWKHCGKEGKWWLQARGDHRLYSPTSFMNNLCIFVQDLVWFGQSEFVLISNVSRYGKIWRTYLLSLSMALTYSHTMTPFDATGKQAFRKHCGQRRIACNEQFLLFPQCFLPVWITFCHFHQIWNCRLQSLSVWKSLKFVVW